MDRSRIVWLLGRKNEGIWNVHIRVENWSPVHRYQQLICLTCCLAFRISPRSCQAFPNPEEPGEEDEDVQMERTRTADAVTALQMNEVVLIKTFFLSSTNNSASLARNIPILILLKVWWGRRTLPLLQFIMWCQKVCSAHDLWKQREHTHTHTNLLIYFSES